MRAAAALGCRLFDRMLGFMQPGMAETAVAAELEHAARLAGAEAMSFRTIVASGERSALPHGHATQAKLPRRGFVTLDFGVVLDGYCSDMTRTVHMGRARAGERDAYDAVLEAQEAGVAAVRAGVTAGEVDEAARSVLRKVGLGEVVYPLDRAWGWAGDSRGAQAGSKTDIRSWKPEWWLQLNPASICRESLASGSRIWSW